MKEVDILRDEVAALRRELARVTALPVPDLSFYVGDIDDVIGVLSDRPIHFSETTVLLQFLEKIRRGIK
jgi:hypothetical protein